MHTQIDQLIHVRLVVMITPTHTASSNQADNIVNNTKWLIVTLSRHHHNQHTTPTQKHHPLTPLADRSVSQSDSQPALRMALTMWLLTAPPSL
mmetsp:Transcript_47141/g.117584  ORF Transcript_47141/g.117584 Transcript_47141/m.117584 type:complete len:93 (+) Transcript_47141:11-289(+)